MFLDFAACSAFLPLEFKTLATLAHHAGKGGAAEMSQEDLAREVGTSASTMCRVMARLATPGHVTRTRIGGNRYRFKIDSRLLATNAEPAAAPTDSPPRVAPVQSVAPVQPAPRARGLSLISSLEVSRTSEREAQALSEGELPEEWMAAVTTARRRVDLPDVNLRVEWAKLVAKEGPPSRSRWLVWALRARLDPTNAPAAAVAEAKPESSMPAVGTDKEHSRAGYWARTGKWAPPGQDWGPAPDQPSCTLPAEIIAWCRTRLLAQRGRQ